MKIKPHKIGVKKIDLTIFFINKKETKKHELKTFFSYYEFEGNKDEFYFHCGKLFFGVAGVKTKDDWRLLGYKVGQKVQKFKRASLVKFGKNLQKNSQEFLEGLYLSYYKFDRYKSNKSKHKVTFMIPNYKELKSTITKAKIITDAQCLVRDLVNTPACDMYQEKVYEEVEKTFKNTDIKVEVYGEDKLKRLGMRGLLAVNQASLHQAIVIKLSYEPKSYKEHVVLIGKGVVYDTGGLSIKPNDSMVTMKYDKAGAITVMGVMKAISELGSDKKVTAYMGMVENAIGPESYRPGDVIKMQNGLNVHVKNTDAEGRLILADLLSQAEKENPNLTSIYTFATLTGAAVKALGHETAALSGFNDKMKNKVIKAGKETDELYANAIFNKYMMNAMADDLADLSNLSSRDTLGSQTAGLFLTNFLTKKVRKKYLHIDMAGPGFAHNPWSLYKKGPTGFGVRTMVKLLSK